MCGRHGNAESLVDTQIYQTFCYFKWTNCALCNLQLEMTQNLQVLKFIFEDLDLVRYRPRVSTCTRFFQSFGKLVLVADSISFWILHVTVLKKQDHCNQKHCVLIHLEQVSVQSFGRYQYCYKTCKAIAQQTHREYFNFNFIHWTIPMLQIGCDRYFIIK